MQWLWVSKTIDIFRQLNFEKMLSLRNIKWTRSLINTSDSSFNWKLHAVHKSFRISFHFQCEQLKLCYFLDYPVTCKYRSQPSCVLASAYNPLGCLSMTALINCRLLCGVSTHRAVLKENKHRAEKLQPKRIFRQQYAHTSLPRNFSYSFTAGTAASMG